MTESPKANEPDWSGLNLPVLTEVVEEQAVPLLAEEAGDVPEFDFSSELDLLAHELEDERQDGGATLEIPELTLADLLEHEPPAMEPAAAALDFSALPSLELDGDAPDETTALDFVLQPREPSAMPMADAYPDLSAVDEAAAEDELPVLAGLSAEEVSWDDVVAAAARLPAAEPAMPDEPPAWAAEEANPPEPDVFSSQAEPLVEPQPPVANPFVSIPLDSLPSGVLGGGIGREPAPETGLEWLNELPKPAGAVAAAAPVEAPSLQDVLLEAERVLAEERAQSAAAPAEPEAAGQNEAVPASVMSPDASSDAAEAVAALADELDAFGAFGAEAEREADAWAEQAQSAQPQDEPVAATLDMAARSEPPLPFMEEDAAEQIPAALAADAGSHEADRRATPSPELAVEAVDSTNADAELAAAFAAFDESALSSSGMAPPAMSEAEPAAESDAEFCAEWSSFSGEQALGPVASVDEARLADEADAELAAAFSAFGEREPEEAAPAAEAVIEPEREVETDLSAAAIELLYEGEAEVVAPAAEAVIEPEREIETDLSAAGIELLYEGEPEEVALTAEAVIEPEREVETDLSAAGIELLYEGEPEVVAPAAEAVIEPEREVETDLSAAGIELLYEGEPEAVAPLAEAVIESEREVETDLSAAGIELLYEGEPEEVALTAEAVIEPEREVEPDLSAAALELMHEGEPEAVAPLAEAVPGSEMASAASESAVAVSAATATADMVEALYEEVPTPALATDDQDMPALSGLLERGQTHTVPPLPDAAAESAVSVVQVSALASAGAPASRPAPAPFDEQALYQALYDKMLPRMKVELSLWLQDAIEAQAKQMLSGMMHQLKEDYEMLFGDALKESLRQALNDAGIGAKEGEQE
ncbi:hypothetical protein [Chromobacterium alticapitis]|uniref:Uncharacterized protein n=1 Tax=Chromobacterium alticapitis TaxID=2073169 RepID=A0A2S5DK53_9NEIS|nr:hypothetical protein [Chromobacterium alticapitis]POZ63463.1 hypothetical protein C2I19_03700 [Chromobacterium alticapitis]